MDDLDDLLDSALDDFRKASISERSSKSAAKAIPTPDKNVSSDIDESDPSVSDDIVNATVGQGLGLHLPSLTPAKKKKTGSKMPLGIPSLDPPRSSRVKKNEQSSSSQNPLSATLEKLAEQTRQTVGTIDTEAEDNSMGEEFVENLMRQFEDLGSSQDMQSIMDTMMRQLLSREVLHEPMREIGERYPEWLATNKAHLSSEDYSRYSKQHGYIMELCDVYQNSPDDFQKIMDLMQSMQNCGQPPSDIVREIAPGLELDQEGLPMLPNFAAEGALGTGPNCRIM